MEKENSKKQSTGIRKIVLTGPESTGKSTLAKQLAEYYSTVYIPEYAREYVENLNGNYNYNDVIKIAKKQIELENNNIENARNYIFYDTGLIITKIWFDVVFKNIPNFINIHLNNNTIDLFLLCNTDILWKHDPARENGGEMREILFNKYKSELEKHKFNYKIIKGINEQRLINAIDIINGYF